MAGAWIIAPQHSDYTQNSETIPFPVFVPYAQISARNKRRGKKKEVKMQSKYSRATQSNKRLSCYAKNTWNFTQKSMFPIAERNFYIMRYDVRRNSRLREKIHTQMDINMYAALSQAYI